MRHGVNGVRSNDQASFGPGCRWTHFVEATDHHITVKGVVATTILIGRKLPLLVGSQPPSCFTLLAVRDGRGYQAGFRV